MGRVSILGIANGNGCVQRTEMQGRKSAVCEGESSPRVGKG